MPIKPGKYIHFKGNEYEVIGTATHSETLEEIVVYRALNDGEKLWVRPAAMWSEIVEHNGRSIRRFTHEDEVVPEPPNGIHNHSTPDEKVELFLSYFAGREDVFAKHFVNKKTGKSGYAPACHNFWGPICPKPSGNKVKCSECKNHNFVKFDAKAVEKHLRGEITIGVYPMLSDETCRFLAFDFDGKECDINLPKISC